MKTLGGLAEPVLGVMIWLVTLTLLLVGLVAGLGGAARFVKMKFQ
jgi:hypothetical protein